MPNAFIRKLEGFVPLGDDDRRWLLSLPTQEVAAGEALIREGDNPEVVHVILAGFATRSKLTPKGGRSIFGYLIPGDSCNLHVAILNRLDHSITALTACRIVRLPARTINEITEQRPALTRALWWSSLVEEATLREWLLNQGQRSAVVRIAHLFCELHVRLKVVGLTNDGSFELPITQADLGDTIALSTVHANRSLQQLRKAELIKTQKRCITIPDIARLKKFSDFDPSYLHIRDHVA